MVDDQPTVALNECRPACPACFMGQHDGHDLGLRHDGGSLYSATCHDCNVTFHRATEPMREAIAARSVPETQANGEQGDGQ